jgi:hypothetical protein
MAEVMLARTTGMGGFEKLFVVKRILPELATNQEFVRMFLDEARIAASLQHPNIVQTFEVDLVDGAVFSAMEFLQGQDVDAIVRRARERGEPIPLEASLAIVQGTAAGLHYAHERRGSDGEPLGIVHRDVSPHNVFVTYDGGVKVIDFGVATAAKKLAQTRFGVVKGKFGYMSPEQCRCEPLDRRSDVFCIGILLYELTTGARLCASDNEWELLKAIAESDPVPPSSRDPAYPPELERIVLRALARDRERRYQTALELARDLESFGRERKLAATPSRLGEVVSGLFAGELAEWRQAEREGVPLSTHVRKTHSSGAGSRAAQVPTTAERRRSRRGPGARWLLAAGLAVVALAAGLVATRMDGDTAPPATAAARPAPVSPAVEAMPAPPPAAAPVPPPAAAGAAATAEPEAARPSSQTRASKKRPDGRARRTAARTPRAPAPEVVARQQPAPPAPAPPPSAVPSRPRPPAKDLEQMVPR